jgi:hypothetical protein
MLKPWLGKAKKIADPPQPSETRDSLSRVNRADRDGLTQLNYKIPHSKKRHIKQLALRDNITLLAMFDRMVELYEREYGKLNTKQ